MRDVTQPTTAGPAANETPDTDATRSDPEFLDTFAYQLAEDDPPDDEGEQWMPAPTELAANFQARLRSLQPRFPIIEQTQRSLASLGPRVSLPPALFRPMICVAALTASVNAASIIRVKPPMPTLISQPQLDTYWLPQVASQPVLDHSGIASLLPNMRIIEHARVDITAKFANMFPTMRLMEDQFSQFQTLARPGGSIFEATRIATQAASLIDNVLTPLRYDITAMFATWNRWAQIGDRIAEWALRTAIQARRAAILGDRQAIRHFARKFLGIVSVTEDVVDAVVDALLDDIWLVGGFDVLDRLKKNAMSRRKSLRPEGERRLNHRTITSLDRPAGASGTASLIDSVEARDAGIPAGINDPRLIEILESLEPVERDVMLTVGDGVSWLDAALEAGLTREDGELVRRRIKRQAKQITTRVG